MISLYEIFESLVACKEDTGYSVADIPEISYHKIGISAQDYPLFFIKNKGKEKKMNDRVLESISIQYDQKCKFYLDGKLIGEDQYTVITLLSDIPTIQEYFMEIMYLLMKKLSPIASLTEIQSEIRILIELFRSFSQPPLKTIQGVWAEMLVVQQADNPDYLINSWHSTIYSRFDFNDGIDKIEVKCTQRDKRVHRFSYSQLEPNPSSNLLIASVITLETDMGKNVFDLRESIFTKLLNKDLIFKVDEILTKTLGKELNKAGNVYFDYNLAIDTLSYFDSNSIPTINETYIPAEISGIKFDCDLSNTPPFDLSGVASLLFQSINK